MARICREAGARVMTNVLVRDLDLNLHDHVDARRLEIVADGLPLFGGAQLAIDTTLVSAVRQDDTPRPGATVRDGVALREARRRKERVCYSVENQFELFRGGFGINWQIRIRISSSRIFFERFEFLVCSKFNHMQRDCTCACAVAFSAHTISFRMLWRP